MNIEHRQYCTATVFCLEGDGLPFAQGFCVLSDWIQGSQCHLNPAAMFWAFVGQRVPPLIISLFKVMLRTSFNLYQNEYLLGNRVSGKWKI